MGRYFATLHGVIHIRKRDPSASEALIEVPFPTQLPDSYGFLIYPKARSGGHALAPQQPPGMEFTGPPKNGQLAQMGAEGLAPTLPDVHSPLTMSGDTPSLG